MGDLIERDAALNAIASVINWSPYEGGSPASQLWLEGAAGALAMAYDDILALPAAPVTVAEAARVLDLIRAAVTEHHLAFDRRQHGGVADRHFTERVQDILGMPWQQGAALRAIAGGEA